MNEQKEVEKLWNVIDQSEDGEEIYTAAYELYICYYGHISRKLSDIEEAFYKALNLGHQYAIFGLYHLKIDYYTINSDLYDKTINENIVYFFKHYYEWLDNNDNMYWDMDTMDLILSEYLPLLIHKIKSQEEKIKSQEEKIEDLEMSPFPGIKFLEAKERFNALAGE